MYGVVVWLDPVPFVAPSVVEDVPPPGWSMHQSNTIRRFATGTGAHCAFRAVGGAVALLHDDSRGLGIAHGRDMWRWFRSEGGGRRSRRVAVSAGAVTFRGRECQSLLYVSS